MADQPITPDESLNPHARGHQEDRIDYRAILLFSLGVVVAIIIVFALLGRMMARFSDAFQAREDRRPPLFEDETGLFPGPRLQEEPAKDMAAMRLEEQRRLTSYGWVDREAGIAHIPIDRAMAILAEQGLPVRQDGGPDDGETDE